MKNNSEIVRNRWPLETLFIFMMIVFVSCERTREIPTGFPKLPPRKISKQFEGEFTLPSGMATYKLDFQQDDFRLYTRLDGDMHLQTHLSEFLLTGVHGKPQAIQITGRDLQAGARPETTIEISLLSDGLYELTRIKPLGGRVGTFRKKR